MVIANYLWQAPGVAESDAPVPSMTPEEKFASWLGEAVYDRRRELELTQEQVAARSGGRLSTATYRLIEAHKAGQMRESTVRGLQEALDWPPYAVEVLRRDLSATGDQDWEWHQIEDVGAILAALRRSGVASDDDAATVSETLASVESQFPFDEWGIRPVTGSAELARLLVPRPPDETEPEVAQPSIDLRPLLDELRAFRRLYEDDRELLTRLAEQIEELAARPETPPPSAANS